MTSTKLFIPTKIKVGFQSRNDTFTQKLGYVIPLGEKGQYRKETSWNSWRNETIEPVEFDNEPKMNFVLNKGVKRYGYWRGSGRSVVRVYDTRDFEFEITVDNLLFILMHADVSKRDIMTECVYAWDKDKLILLPTNSQEYQESTNYTAQQFNKVSAKTLIPGATYKAKKTDEELVYLGYFENFAIEHSYDGPTTTYQKSKGKKHTFALKLGQEYEWQAQRGWEFKTPSMDFFSHVVDENVHPQFAEATEKFFTSYYGSKIVGVEIAPGKYYSGSMYKEIGGRCYRSWINPTDPNSDRYVTFGDDQDKYEVFSDVKELGEAFTNEYSRARDYTYWRNPPKAANGCYAISHKTIRNHTPEELFAVHGIGKKFYKLENGKKVEA